MKFGRRGGEVEEVETFGPKAGWRTKLGITGAPVKRAARRGAFGTRGTVKKKNRKQKQTEERERERERERKKRNIP